MENNDKLVNNNLLLKNEHRDLREALESVAGLHDGATDMRDADEAINLLHLDTERQRLKILDLLTVGNSDAGIDDLISNVLMAGPSDLVAGAIARIISNTRRATDIEAARIARAALRKIPAWDQSSASFR